MLLQRLNKNDLPQIIAFNRRCFSPVRRRRTTRAKLVCFGGAETGCARFLRLLQNSQREKSHSRPLLQIPSCRRIGIG